MQSSDQVVSFSLVKAMNSNMNVDIPKRKVKQTKAMVYRSHQQLKQQLIAIDSEQSKSLSNINRDLELAKDALKAFRVNQKQARRESIARHSVSALGSGLDFGLKVMSGTSTPSLQRRQCGLSFGRNSSLHSPGHGSTSEVSS